MKPLTRWMLVAAYIIVACATSATTIYLARAAYRRVDEETYIGVFVIVLGLVVFYAQLMGVGAAYYKIKEWAASRGL